MKNRKLLFSSIFVLLNISAVSKISALDIEFSLLPQIDFHTVGVFETAFSGTASMDFYPLTIRGRDKIGFSLQGGITDIKAQTLNDTPLYYGDFALDYSCRIHDRFGAGVQAFAGFWKFPQVEEKNTKAENGILAGGRIFAEYYVLPELKAGVFAGMSKFLSEDDAFAQKFDLGLKLTYSFSKGIFKRSSVEMDESEVQNVFPVFYSFYNENPFGKVVFFNGEENQINNVKVSVLIPEYMTNPKTCVEIPSVARSDYFNADLTAFINETILGSLMAHRTECRIIVTYRSLGKTITSEHLLDINALNRNAMSWDDDRRAAAFVSSHDGAATKISKLAKSLILKNPTDDYTHNISFARGIFATLKAFGISYVKDPTSPFTSNLDQEIDFLQFPYQTLLYSGGDCDDLSILNCALFESIGIEAAFITIPGHIFMAFDSGVSEADAAKVIRDGRYIVQDGKVWIPLEATMCQESFEGERNAGWNQWNSAKKKGEAALYPIHEAWNLYKAVSVPESDTDIELPSLDRILKYLR